MAIKKKGKAWKITQINRTECPYYKKIIYSNRYNGTLPSLVFILGLFLWMSNVSLIQSMGSVLQLPIIWKFSNLPMHLFLLIWFKIAELLTLLGLNMNLFPVANEIPKCSKTRTS